MSSEKEKLYSDILWDKETKKYEKDRKEHEEFLEATKAKSLSESLGFGDTFGI